MMVYVFGNCELDPSRFELRCGGQIQPMKPQVFDVLVLLVRERRRVVSKQELFDQVWGHRFVGESALTSRIKSVRHAIGDDGTAQHTVRTVRTRGYRFVGDVAERADRLTAATPPPARGGEAAESSSAVELSPSWSQSPPIMTARQVQIPADAVPVSAIPKGSQPPARSAIHASPSATGTRNDTTHRRRRRLESSRSALATRPH